MSAKVTLNVCTSQRACARRGSCDLAKQLRECVAAQNLSDQIAVTEDTGCMGPCGSGPIVEFQPSRELCGKASAEQIVNAAKEKLEEME